MEKQPHILFNFWLGRKNEKYEIMILPEKERKES